MVLGMLLAMGLNANAQAPTSRPNGLPAARLGFDRSLTKATLPELKQFIEELSALEKRAAAARDYPAALTLSKERKAAEAELELLAKRAALLDVSQPASSAPSLRLSASAAKLNGPSYAAAEDAIIGWSSSAASATWTLPSLAPGGYDVVLYYSCAGGEGGSLVVKEAFYTLARDLKSPTQGLAQQTLGTLRIREGAGTFTITARTVLGGNLMHLHAVELLPASR